MLWPYPTASEAFMVAVYVCSQPRVNVYRNETQSFMGSETELLFPTYGSCTAALNNILCLYLTVYASLILLLVTSFIFLW